MKFIVEREIFEKLPSACFGVVMAKGIDNSKAYPEIDRLLDESIEAAAQRFEGKKVKEEPNILAYREAFRTLDINPNKYLCSIEALFTRIAKGKGMPHINPVVDLGNAVSLKYTLPMGAHDLGSSSEDICIRPARSGDTFLPFGSDTEETPDIGEVVYTVGQQVPASTDIFFPIDGFTDFNRDWVFAARNELQALVKRTFGCETVVGFVDSGHPEIEL